MAKASPFGVARWRLQGRCRTKSPNADTFEHHLFRVFRLPSGSPIPYGVEVSLWPIELFGTRLQTPLCASTFPGFRLGVSPLTPSATRTIKHGTGQGVKRYLFNIAFDRRAAFGLYVGSGIGPRGDVSHCLTRPNLSASGRNRGLPCNASLTGRERITRLSALSFIKWRKRMNARNVGKLKRENDRACFYPPPV